MLIFGVFGAIVGLYIAFGHDNWKLGDRMPTGIGRGDHRADLGLSLGPDGHRRRQLRRAADAAFGTPIHRAVGTASGFGMVIAVPSVIVLPADRLGTPDRPPYSIGMVNLPAFVLVVATTMITTPWGVRLAHAMNAKPLKRVFGGFLILVALNMLREALLG